jgi:hypothetical protein
MIAAPRSIAIEISPGYTACEQVFSRRRSILDTAGRTDVVGRYRISEDGKCPRVPDLVMRAGLQREILEKRWFCYVGRFRPIIDFP